MQVYYFMQIDLSALPERYQKQVLRKIAEQGKAKAPPAPQNSKKSKYHNIKTVQNGIRFDSKKEARRFLQLRAMEQAGEISGLKLQVNFTLQEGYTKPDGERVRPIVYKADFTYRRKDEEGRYTLYIVEDVKSGPTRTAAYRLKRKLFREKYGMDITEV